MRPLKRLPLATTMTGTLRQTVSSLWMLKCGQILSFLTYIPPHWGSDGSKQNLQGLYTYIWKTTFKESACLIKSTGTSKGILVICGRKSVLILLCFIPRTSFLLVTFTQPSSYLLSIKESVETSAWILSGSVHADNSSVSSWFLFFFFHVNAQNNRWLALMCLALRVVRSPGDATKLHTVYDLLGQQE